MDQELKTLVELVRILNGERKRPEKPSIAVLPIEQISAATTIAYVNGMKEGIFKYALPYLKPSVMYKIIEHIDEDWAEELKSAYEKVKLAEVSPNSEENV